MQKEEQFASFTPVLVLSLRLNQNTQLEPPVNPSGVHRSWVQCTGELVAVYTATGIGAFVFHQRYTSFRLIEQSFVLLSIEEINNSI
ncbi:MAG: hypothetical protein ACK5JU_02700 [Bacteroidales bacterium]